MKWDLRVCFTRSPLNSGLIDSIRPLPLPSSLPLRLLFTELILLLPLLLGLLDTDHLSPSLFFLLFSLCIAITILCSLHFHVPRTLRHGHSHFTLLLWCPHADVYLHRTITRVWRRPPGWTVAVRRHAVLVILPPPAPLLLRCLRFLSLLSFLLCCVRLKFSFSTRFSILHFHPGSSIWHLPARSNCPAGGPRSTRDPPPGPHPR